MWLEEKLLHDDTHTHTFLQNSHMHKETSLQQVKRPRPPRARKHRRRDGVAGKKLPALWARIDFCKQRRLTHLPVGRIGASALRNNRPAPIGFSLIAAGWRDTRKKWPQRIALQTGRQKLMGAAAAVAGKLTHSCRPKPQDLLLALTSSVKGTSFLLILLLLLLFLSSVFSRSKMVGGSGERKKLVAL